MFLNIFTSIKEFINGLLAKFSWGSVVILFTGIIIGFLICVMIYLVIVLVSLRKNDEYIHKSDAQIEDEEIKRLIRNARNQYYERSAYLNTAQKITEVKEISWQLMNDIAMKFYPKSNYPLYELSIDELMILNHYITNRVDQLFKGKVLKGFKKVKISQILKLIDIKKKIDENKMVKAANKVKIPGIMKATLSVLNVFNPGYWVKKLMINTTLSIGTNKLASLIIDIVGEETTKVYSKSVFNEEKVIESEVEKTILELEEGLESGNV
ncbi:MAG TPA: hypothetical protein GXZ48_01485 [Acholeplasmataceae bacterium]|jgi:hypothetical protein|nr:hypothetical protein [Acholeplasmataceae bacterium]